MTASTEPERAQAAGAPTGPNEAIGTGLRTRGGWREAAVAVIGSGAALLTVMAVAAAGEPVPAAWVTGAAAAVIVWWTGGGLRAREALILIVAGAGLLAASGSLEETIASLGSLPVAAIVGWLAAAAALVARGADHHSPTAPSPANDGWADVAARLDAVEEATELGSGATNAALTRLQANLDSVRTAAAKRADVEELDERLDHLQRSLNRQWDDLTERVHRLESEPRPRARVPDQVRNLDNRDPEQSSARQGIESVGAGPAPRRDPSSLASLIEGQAPTPADLGRNHAGTASAGSVGSPESAELSLQEDPAPKISLDHGGMGERDRAVVPADAAVGDSRAAHRVWDSPTLQDLETEERLLNAYEACNPYPLLGRQELIEAGELDDDHYDRFAPYNSDPDVSEEVQRLLRCHRVSPRFR